MRELGAEVTGLAVGDRVAAVALGGGGFAEIATARAELTVSGTGRRPVELGRRHPRSAWRPPYCCSSRPVASPPGTRFWCTPPPAVSAPFGRLLGGNLTLTGFSDRGLVAGASSKVAAATRRVLDYLAEGTLSLPGHRTGIAGRDPPGQGRASHDDARCLIEHASGDCGTISRPRQYLSAPVN
ncbi:hypothetical protein [Nocardia nova]|uniref:hypothetical protein n=1 Tax=Nocardia nova TaxID=37330 RepID=UPI0011B09C8B|nr:hypothetical protein [Nocardia nova]